MKKLTPAKVRMYRDMLEKLRRWTETGNPKTLLEQDFDRYMKMFDKLASLLADDTSTKWELADAKAQIATLRSQVDKFHDIEPLLHVCLLQVANEPQLRNRIQTAIRMISLYDKKPNTKLANTTQRETPLQPAGL